MLDMPGNCWRRTNSWGFLLSGQKEANFLDKCDRRHWSRKELDAHNQLAAEAANAGRPTWPEKEGRWPKRGVALEPRALDPRTLLWWALQEAISKDTISAKFQCSPPSNVCLQPVIHSCPAIHPGPHRYSLTLRHRHPSPTQTLTYGSYSARRTNRLTVLSNVKGSLVLLFYQSNKLEMFACPLQLNTPQKANVAKTEEGGDAQRDQLRS